MLPSSGTIYRYEWKADPPGRPRPSLPESLIIPFKGQTRKKSAVQGSFRRRAIAFGLVIFALGGLSGPVITKARLEAKYKSLARQNKSIETQKKNLARLPAAVPVVYNPLQNPDGTFIQPVNMDFSLVVPKIGINSPVVGSVNPTDTKAYNKLLKQGIAHADTSFFPGENGTTYLFSHSTNYEWFVKDLNAIFYLLKNVEAGDSVVVFYKGKQYNYKVSQKKVVKPRDVTYLYPTLGKKQLILETCWPPGSVAERLLIFADLVETEGQSI